MICWHQWEIQDEHKMEFHVQESVVVALSFWVVVKHLQLCNGQVRLVSINFQLGFYIGTMVNNFHKLKQR
jgi:hypothetical protein